MKKTIIIFSIILLTSFINVKTVEADAPIQDSSCGHTYTPGSIELDSCNCASGKNDYTTVNGDDHTCCGWVTPLFINGQTSDVCTGVPNVVIPPADITKGLNKDTFNSFNPLKITGSPVAEELSTPGGILSRLLNFLFPLAGLVLFLLISLGGFEILLNSANQKGMEAGKNRVTAAIVGFILLFSTYWMAQIVEVIFGIAIL